MNYVMDLRRLVGTRPLIVPGTSVLVVEEDRLLLLERADGAGWALPGGFMELGESLEETGRREVREETGLEITDLALLGVFSGPECYYRYPHGDELYNVTAAYTARVAGGDPRPDPREADQMAFFALDEIPEHILVPERPVVDAFLRSRGRPAGAHVRAGRAG
jgi:ADP-ribose pyrophosphatase YjhB (NUDIX family)